jgi:ATP adenylyltransferase
MTQDRLWAPWRRDYVANIEAHSLAKPVVGGTGCFLCDNLAATRGRARGDLELKRHLVLMNDERGAVMLNRFPYCNGHLLIARPEHVSDLSGYEPGQRAGLMELAALGERLLREAYNAQGVNVGINIGRAAGAGVPGHLHIHVVPRWSGDVNFMEVVGGVRVIPEAIEKSFDLLSDVLEREGKSI